MSDEKISTKVLCAIFATGILSFCGVAGETAMNITFPRIDEGIFSQYVNRTVGYNHLSPSGRLRGSLICLSQALV